MRTVIMADSRPGNDTNRKPSRYFFPLIIGGAGVISLVVGLFILGWVWLALLGFILIIAAAFSIRISIIGGWVPTLLTAKEGDHEDSLTLPPIE
jgi:hypothetical protein